MSLRWASRAASAWDTVRSSYWFLPGAMAAAAAGAAALALEADRRHSIGAYEDWPWVSDMGVDGARAVVSVVAGSMITVTGVVFSITIVALTLASSQFGPRLLRNFMRDRGNQFVLGTFVATFLFNLLVLWAIEGHGDVTFVPRLSATIGVVMGVISLFVLIYFIHHAATSIQASSIIESVGREIDASLGALFPEGLGSGHATGRHADDALCARLTRDGVPVGAPCAGYVRVVDEEQLLRVACEADLLVGLARRPGAFVAAGSPLAWLVGAGTDATRVAAVQACFVVGSQRTPVQDFTFLTQQLSEMAVRALSPGVNDPSTAEACVHRLGAALAQLAERSTPDSLRFDDDEILRTVVLDPLDFAALVESMFGPIRRYGAEDADVVVAVLGAIAEATRRTTDPARHRVLRQLADEMRAESDRHQHVESEHRRVAQAAARVGAA
jgi:uncharacterized membrane protein